VDFSDPGPLGAFTDAESIRKLEQKMSRTGFLDAADMEHTFNSLRANDLVWNYVASNWLMGEDPPAFDILAWNADSTRMPAAMHSFYLRYCYQENQLARDEMTLAGRNLKLADITGDVYIVGAVEDHIAPWKTTYKGARYLGGDVRFVLGGSGHIAGIGTPPAAKKYHYWANDALPASAEEWFAGAKQQPGSWWDDWQRWIDTLNAGEKVPARIPANAIEDAPGGYAMMRLLK